jgi:predicted dehydrogenase
MKTDRLASAILEFPSGHSIFTCSTQLAPYQRMQFFGTKGRVEVEIPFNAPPDRPVRIFIEDANGIETEEFAACDQYTLAGRRVFAGDSGEYAGSGAARRRAGEYGSDRKSPARVTAGRLTQKSAISSPAPRP